MRKSGGEPMSCGYSPTPPAACAWSAHSPSKPTKTGSKPTATSIWTNCASRRKPNYAKPHDQHHDRQFAELDAHNRLSRRVHGAGLDCRWQGRFFALIVADRHFLDGFDCRVFWGPSSPCLSLEGGPATIALDIPLEDGGVMNETVDGRERHGGIRDRKSVV